MKLSSLLPLIIGFFSMPLVAQEPVAPAPQRTASLALPPAGARRPPQVPGDFVITPFGYFHPSCILQLKQGEYRTSANLLHHTDGIETQVPVCRYQHFSPDGSVAAIPASQAPAVEPVVGHSWIENASAVTSTSYGKQVTTWKVPPLPLTHDGQTIFLFPGFEDISAVQSILQPVIGSYDGSNWTMASWNCCLANTADESTPVNINAGDVIVGTTQMTCAAGTLSCATWNVTTQDQTTNQTTTLSNSLSDGQTFNWAFAGALEVYNVNQCLDYPPNATVTFTNQLYDNSFNLIASPTWGLGKPDSTIQPQCNYGVTATVTQTTLSYGTTAPSFGLDVSPAVGIAVNQGSSASGNITVTDINGFTGPVQISLSTPPNGISAQLTQGSSANAYVLTLTASSTAAITGSSTPAVLTVTAVGSGVSTQTFPVDIIVNPPLAGGIGTVVSLAGAYNTYGFFNDSVGYPTLNVTNSLDAGGSAYSANVLNPPALSPMALDLNGAQFNFGTPNLKNAVYGTGSNPIALPSVSSNELQILASGVNGSQASQTIVVTYTDGTTQSFIQTFDDWTAGPCNSSKVCTAGESVAITMPYTDSEYVYSRNDSLYYLYAYSFALNPAKTLKSLTLPTNRNVVVLAATAVNVTATPTISLAGGTITPPQSVTLADSTSGAVIYYTTNGTTPTATSAVYSGAITVSSTETLKAIAIANGDLSSAVASATYTVPPPTFAMAGTALSIAPGVTTGNTSIITLTPSYGFTGAVNLSCTITPTAASDPATCSVPASMTVTGTAPQTVVLTVNTTAATAALRQPAKLLWRSASSAALAGLLLVGFPARRRRKSILVMLLSLSVLAGATGCSKSTSSGGSTRNPGTTPGAYSITVTGTSGTITQIATIALTVQ